MTIPYRQGDVLLIATKTLATGRCIDSGVDIVLALGESTGHSHRAVATIGNAHDVIGVENDDHVPAMELFEEPDGTRLLVVRREARVTHQEHGPITLAPGAYKVIRQREYTPAAIRPVAD